MMSAHLHIRSLLWRLHDRALCYLKMMANSLPFVCSTKVAVIEPNANATDVMLGNCTGRYVIVILDSVKSAFCQELVPSHFPLIVLLTKSLVSFYLCCCMLGGSLWILLKSNLLWYIEDQTQFSTKMCLTLNCTDIEGSFCKPPHCSWESTRSQNVESVVCRFQNNQLSIKSPIKLKKASEKHFEGSLLTCHPRSEFTMLFCLQDRNNMSAVVCVQVFPANTQLHSKRADWIEWWRQ